MNSLHEKPTAVFAEVLEQSAVDQFKSAMDCEFAVQGALMPDAHTGYTLPIGAVVATRDVVVPAWVGYDIGCGMCAMRTTFNPEDVKASAKAIFADIYKAIPVGFSHNHVATPWSATVQPSQKTQEIFNKNGLLQLGSLGSGNHFIEVGYDGVDGAIWVVIHSGSRGLGHSVASHYMALAAKSDKPVEGHYGLPVDSKVGKDYIADLKFCLEFALANRLEMINRVMKVLATHCRGGAEPETLINRNHNHAEERDGLWIHRKGATHAEDGMMGVIPGNMRDGSFIVRGKGNPSSLYSSSHGAGRVMGRKQAQRTLSMEGFAADMEGVTALVTEATLDESPLAYKDIFQVMELQADLVEVVAHVRPIINIKG